MDPRPAPARPAGLPPGLAPELERLVAGKWLLLFSLLERAAGRLDGARRWHETALQVAGDDPEVRLYAAQARRVGWLTPTAPTVPLER